MDIFLIWAVVQVILSSNQVFGQDASILDEFDTCHKDQSTGLKAFFAKNSGNVNYAGCILHVGSKYCYMKCLFDKYAMIVRNENPNRQRIINYVDEFHNIPEKEALRNASVACTSKKRHPNCKEVQEWHYCFYNEFIRICKIKKPRRTFNEDENNNEDLVDLGLRY